jgi:hypothetical protein
VRAELRVLPLREDHRRTSNGDQTYRVARLAMKRKQSVDFTAIGRGRLPPIRAYFGWIESGDSLGCLDERI